MERNYEFRKRLLQVHKPDRRMVFTPAAPGEVEITNDWTVYLADHRDPVLYHAGRDLVDYFAVSMGLSLKLQIGGAVPSNAIVYAAEELSANQYRIQVTQNQITLSGRNSRTAAQAGYHLEDLMNLAQGPYLQLQDTVKKPLYEVRMTHSGYGLDDFPDQHLNAIAHAGFTAIVLFVRGYNHAANSYLDFNNLIHRAASYGLDVYA